MRLTTRLRRPTPPLTRDLLSLLLDWLHEFVPRFKMRLLLLECSGQFSRGGRGGGCLRAAGFGWVMGRGWEMLRLVRGGIHVWKALRVRRVEIWWSGCVGDHILWGLIILCGWLDSERLRAWQRLAALAIGAILTPWAIIWLYHWKLIIY